MVSILTEKDVSEVINELENSGKPFCGFEVLNSLLRKAGAFSYITFEPLGPAKSVRSYLSNYADKRTPLKITHCRCGYKNLPIPKSGQIELSVDAGPVPLKCVIDIKKPKYREFLQNAIANAGSSLEVYGTPRKDEPNVIDTDILVFYYDVVHWLFTEDAFNMGYSVD